VQRNGFRYIPAEVVGEEEINGRYVESFHHSKVTLSLYDRSPEISLERNERVVASGGRCGYRSIFATHGVEAGNWYFEVEILEGEPQAHARFGFGRMGAKVGGPVGMDCRGFGFCDSGHIAHQARKKGILGRSWGPGDRIGCQIYLPTAQIPLPKPTRTVVDYNRQVYFEEILPDPKGPDPAEPLSGSWIRFYVNGTPISGSPVFTELPQGKYYPMLSLYRDAKIRAIFDAESMSHIPQDVTPWEMAYQVEELVVTSASLQRSQSDSIEPAVVEAADMATLLPGIVTR
jgi:hypothetical protein